MRKKRTRRGGLRWFFGWRPYSYVELHQSYRSLPKLVSLSAVRAGRHTNQAVRTRADLDTEDVSQLECWLEIPLDDGQWICAYRLVPQEGRPVVAELRVFPAEPENEKRPAGRWSGELFTIHSQLPRGGLSATLLRQVRVGEHLEWGEAFHKEFYAAFEGQADDDFYRLGMVDFIPKETGGDSRPRLRRRPGEDLFLARVAEAYAGVVADGSRRPIVDVARRLKLSDSKVRSAVHRARKRGFLTPARKQGSRGGELTRSAATVLRAAARTRRKGYGKKK